MIVESIMASGLKLPSKKFINDNSNDREYFELLRRSVIAAIPEIKPEGETGIKLTTHSGTYSLGCVSFLPFAIEDLKEMHKLGSPPKEGKLLSVNQLINKFKNHGVKVLEYPFEQWETCWNDREDLKKAKEMVEKGWTIIATIKDRKRINEGKLPKDALMFKKGRLYLSTGFCSFNYAYQYNWNLQELKDVFVTVEKYESLNHFLLGISK
jgi:hypothetical protein